MVFQCFTSRENTLFGSLLCTSNLMAMIFLSLTNEFGEVEEIQLLFSQLQWKSQVQASKENFIGGCVDRSF